VVEFTSVDLRQRSRRRRGERAKRRLRVDLAQDTSALDENTPIEAFRKVVGSILGASNRRWPRGLASSPSFTRLATSLFPYPGRNARVARAPPWIGNKHRNSEPQPRSRQDCGKTNKGLYSVSTNLGVLTMRYSSQVKPISYLKANAAELLARLAEQREPLVITQNGEAKAVLQDVASFEETQETLALLKILALGQQDIEVGRVKPAVDVVARLRARRTAD